MALSEGRDHADVEAGGGSGNEVCPYCLPGAADSVLGDGKRADVLHRTGAPPQRGSIVNISSVLGRVGNATAGSVGARQQRRFDSSLAFRTIPANMDI